MPPELPTRSLDVPPIKRLTNALLTSASTVTIIFLVFLFNFLVFPTVAGTIVPLAFSSGVQEILGRGLAIDLSDSASNLVGRPVADTVLTSVVMPATGILFATLTSTTLGTLRTRQQDLRTALRKECTAVETLLQPAKKLFAADATLADAHRYSRFLCLLLQYTEDVMADTSSLTTSALKRSLFDSERDGMLAVLSVIGELDAELIADGQQLQRTIVYSRVVGYAQGLCLQINGVRASRRSAYLSSFPAVHWLLLVVLGVTIPTLFVILASTYKGATVELLSDGLIRLLFAALSTSITGLLILLADLNDPFAGNYEVRDGYDFEAPRQQIYQTLRDLAAANPGLREEHERLARLATQSSEAVAAAIL